MGIYFNDWSVTAKFKIESYEGLKSLDASYWVGNRVRVEFNSEGTIEGICKKFQVQENTELKKVVRFEIEVEEATGNFTGRPDYLFRPDDVVKIEKVEAE
ncbi:hypothetical protein SAMN06269117_1424 [Balnearium lithotrophicum]|uniref:Uncharacterized protein n=1 Tax=Balnearium lithotrophicum TaxID=223788 RepID=A0A521EII4_9BACT|nr:hypothetical protein [Balnearium lithotrophicum]SMO83734.1 hypothetical protein SAMN06269117_1424 [Balnearium lithotrophicum]